MLQFKVLHTSYNIMSEVVDIVKCVNIYVCIYIYIFHMTYVVEIVISDTDVCFDTNE